MKVLSLFGPVNPRQFHIAANNTAYVYKQLYCSPCLHVTGQVPCYYHTTPPCMDLVSVQEVISKLEGLFQAPAELYAVANQDSLLEGNGEIPFGVMRSGNYEK
jgi:ADP-heptose:LPS heptosyltransferase